MFGVARAVGRGMALAVVIGAAPALGGPARFDPAKREFHLTYTYADLPGALGSIAGRPREAPAAQDARVRALIEEVSRILFVITDGRARVGSFEQVTSIPQADVVISLTGDPGRAAWANLGAAGGAEGHVAFYYQYLEPRLTADVALTAAHELCHYLFALPDEYPPAPGCPDPRQQPGPGCLMDNYWSQGGRQWYQRLCRDEDHNRQIDVAFAGRSYPSCQALLNAYFKPFEDRGQMGPPGEGGATLDRSRQVVAINETIRNTRAEAMKLRRRAVPVSPEIIRGFIRQTLEANLRKQSVPAIAEEIAAAAEQIFRIASFVGLEPPPGLRKDEALVSRLRRRAEELAQFLRRARPTAGDADRTRLIRDGLRQLLPTGSAPDSATLAFLEDLAQNAAVAAPAERELRRPRNVDELSVRQGQLSLEVLAALSARQNLPMTDAVFDRMKELDRLAGDFGLPRRTTPRFGARTTLLIAPPPLSPAFEYVPVQSGFEPYADLTGRYIEVFARLIQRNQVELRRPTLDTGERGARAALAAPLPTNLLGFDAEGMRAEQRRRALRSRELLNEVLGRLRRDEVENIAILIPPGGLPTDLRDAIRDVRDQLMGQTDVRLDLVQVGTARIDPLLRDLCLRSGGSVLTVTDTHEVGPIAQRLRNEQSAGAWLALPREFDIPSGRRPAGQPLPLEYPENLTGAELRRRMSEKAAATLEWLLSGGERPAGLRTLGVESPLATLRAQAGRLTEVLDAQVTVEEAAKPPNTAVVAAMRQAVDLARSDPMQPGEVIRQLDRLQAALVRIRAGLSAAPPPPERADERRAGLVGQLVEAKTAEDAMGEVLRRLRPALGIVADEAARAGAEQALAELRKAHGELVVALRAAELGLAAQPGLLPVFVRFQPGPYHQELRRLEGTDPRMDGRTIRFYADRDSEIEIIVGLSHLPDWIADVTDEDRRKFERRELVRPVLLDDQGRPSDQAGFLEYDDLTSTPYVRVYRFRDKKTRGTGGAEPDVRPEGWYRIRLEDDPEYANLLLADTIRCTASVASLRPNVQLNVGLYYSPANAGAARGTFDAAEPDPDNKDPIVEVQVYGGVPILGATVQGFYQRLGEFSGAEGEEDALNAYFPVEFHDDGDHARHGDRAKDDGIYSARIPLDPSTTPRGGAEYRFAIQAYTTPDRAQEARNILPEPSGAEPAGKALSGDITTALPFQRATSFRIRVENREP